MLPFTLKAGDTVDIIATGSYQDVLPEVLKKSVALLKDWGLQPRHSGQIFGQHPIYVNSDEKRFENLKQALEAPDSKVVWALRGGCGTTRLLPGLAQLKPPKHPKLVIGFSDLTALNLFVHQKWGWPALHGPVLKQLAEHKVVSPIKELLFGRQQQVVFEGLHPLNAAARMQGEVKAPVTGGNLSLIQSSIGTPWQLQSEGHILLLEDVDEKAYRTAERLEHLRQAGLFRHVKAIIFGEFNFNEPVEQIHKHLYPAVLTEFADAMEVPVLSCQEFGHGKINKPFLLGAPGVLRMGDVFECLI